MNALSFETEAATIHGVTWASPRSPPSPSEASRSRVLLVHGLAGCTIEWELVGQSLADALSTDVIAVDLPGFGRTRLPRGQSGIPLHTRAVTAVLREVGPAAVVANSMGAVVSMAVAAEAPALVEALVLVDPALLTRGGPAGRARAVRVARYAIALAPGLGPVVIRGRRRRAGSTGYVDQRLAVIVADPARVPPEVRGRLVAQAEERAGFAESARCYSTSVRSIVTGARAAWAAVPRVVAPTLVVHGRHDALVPVAMIERLRALRPDWDYEIFEDAGHQPYLEIPDEFVSTVAPWILRHVQSPGPSPGS